MDFSHGPHLVGGSASKSRATLSSMSHRNPELSHLTSLWGKASKSRASLSSLSHRNRTPTPSKRGGSSYISPCACFFISSFAVLGLPHPGVLTAGCCPYNLNLDYPLSLRQHAELLWLFQISFLLLVICSLDCITMHRVALGTEILI